MAKKLLAEYTPGYTAYPMVLQPQLHRRVWGGQRLLEVHTDEAPVLGPVGEPVGESWLACDASVVTNGAYAGRTLGELATAYGAHLVGSVAYDRYGARTPLLAKLLDAAQPLSVQVHPDDTYALSKEAATGHLGKAEAWYVLSAQPAATVLWGLRPGVTPQGLQTAALAGSLPELMYEVPVQAGSVIVNPAGTVHAVGAGIFLFEIQQASDLTYRIYDYGRSDAAGQPRQLHLQKAVEVTDFSGTPFSTEQPAPLTGGWQRLVSRPEFVLDRARLSPGSPAIGEVSAQSLEILNVARGGARFVYGGVEHADQLTLRAGQTIFLPAALEGSYEVSGSAEVLRSAVAREA